MPELKSEKFGLKKPCTQCGAELKYSAGTEHLLCPYCNHKEVIANEKATVVELNIQEYLSEMGSLSHSEEIAILNCRNCGAPQHVQENYQSLQCVYCSNPLLIEDEKTEKWILPGAVLPFQLEQDKSHAIFKKWVASLWFAPNVLKEVSLDSKSTKGLYLPYWTFDAQLNADYQGQRGMYYYETVNYTTTENGKRVKRTRQERKTRWEPASGSISGFVDDTLINASNKHRDVVPRGVASWDLDMLKPFDNRYLSGYITEKYTVPLEKGNIESHHEARRIAEIWACRDIGGDTQRVSSINPRLSDETFKHILLPLYVSTYKYKDKVYHFYINGQSGVTAGDRPYSFWKIFFMVLVILLVVGVFAVMQG